MANRQDIAQYAKVSVATVSNVLNNTKYVSPELRERVLEAARLFDYSVEKHRRTTPSKVKEVVLVVDDLYNPHYWQILEGMYEVASQNGWAVGMMKLWKNVDQFCDMLIDRHVDGVFFSVNHEEIKADNLQKLADADVFLIGSTCVFDYKATMEQTVSYLQDLGHTRIAYLSGLSIKEKNNLRYTAYLDCMRSKGLPLDEDLSIDGIYPYETTLQSGYWAMKSRLELNDDFTAVIALNDLQALGAIKAINEKGLRVPEDISVIGCDDIFFSEFSNPPLTTLRMPADKIGQQAMYHILQRGDGSGYSPVHLKMELIIRASTGRCRNSVSK